MAGFAGHIRAAASGSQYHTHILKVHIAAQTGVVIAKITHRFRVGIMMLSSLWTQAPFMPQCPQPRHGLASLKYYNFHRNFLLSIKRVHRRLPQNRLRLQTLLHPKRGTERLMLHHLVPHNVPSELCQGQTLYAFGHLHQTNSFYHR